MRVAFRSKALKILSMKVILNLRSISIIADDLRVMNSKLIYEYAPMKMFDSVLIKPIQI